MANPFELTSDCGDETPLPLTADAERVALSALVEVLDCARQLYRDVRGNKLEAGMRKTLCSLIEFKLADLFKALGYDGVLAAEVDERYRQVREANAEVHRLKQLIGSSRGFDGVPELLSAMSREMRECWEGLGFSLVSDAPSDREAAGYGAGFGHMHYRAHLSTSLGSKIRHLLPSKTPASDEQAERAFRAQMQEHYDLGREPGSSRELVLLDTDRNRQSIRTALKVRFPSLLLVAWDSRHLGQGDQQFMLWGCDILIRDCGDLLPPDSEAPEVAP